MITLVESPIPVLLAGLIAVAILAVLFFNTGRGLFLAIIAGVVVLVLAGLAVERFVVTEREEVETALYGLAGAMEANDKNAAVALLSPSAAETRARAEWAFARFEIKQANISNLEIEINNLTSPPSATAQFDGFIQVHDRKETIPYNAQNFYFTVHFEKEDDRWLITGHEERIGGIRGRSTKEYRDDR